MKSIKTAETLMNWLNDYKQPIQVSLVTKTKLTMRKKDIETKKVQNPYNDVWKVQTKIATLNPQYTQTVNEQRVEEGKEADFEAQKQKWGEQFGSMLIKDNQMYLRMVVDKVCDTKYYSVNPANSADHSKPLEYDVLAPFIPVSTNKSQGTDSPIIFNSVKMESILFIECEEFKFGCVWG